MTQSLKNPMMIRFMIEPTDEVTDIASRLVIQDGWGVFESNDDTIGRLRSVKLRADEAEAEAMRLGEIESVLELGANNSATAVRKPVSFTVQRVKLNNFEPEIVVYASYRRVG